MNDYKKKKDLAKNAGKSVASTRSTSTWLGRSDIEKKEKRAKPEKGGNSYGWDGGPAGDIPPQKKQKKNPNPPTQTLEKNPKETTAHC